MANWSMRVDEGNRVLWIDYEGSKLSAEDALRSAKEAARYFGGGKRWHLCGALDTIEEFERDKTDAWNHLFKELKPQLLSVRCAVAQTSITARLLRTAINIWGTFIRTPIRMYGSRAEIRASFEQEGIRLELR